MPNQCDLKLLRQQIGALGIAEIAKRLEGDWVVSLTHTEWWDRYTKLPELQEGAQKFTSAIWVDKLKGMQGEMEWTEKDMAVGKDKVRCSRIKCGVRN